MHISRLRNELKLAISLGYLTRINQLLRFLPLEVWAERIDIRQATLLELVKDAKKFKLWHVIQIANYLSFPYRMILTLVNNQIKFNEGE